MSHDPKRIYDVASSFFMAADRCFEKHKNEDKTFQMPLVPAVVCTAFGIELGMKSILSQEGKKVTGHELKKLFIKLSSESKNELSELMDMPESELRKKIITISKVFVEWRYIYEKNQAILDETFIRKLANKVHILATNKIN